MNAGAAWAAEIGEMAGQRLPVTPARGQIVLTEPLPRFIHRVISGAEPSARQTRRGNIIIGGTVEDVGFDKRVTPETIDHFARGVVRTTRSRACGDPLLAGSVREPPYSTLLDLGGRPISVWPSAQTPLSAGRRPRAPRAVFTGACLFLNSRLHLSRSRAAAPLCRRTREAAI